MIEYSTKSMPCAFVMKRDLCPPDIAPSRLTLGKLQIALGLILFTPKNK
jgi:hypothetical protein